LLLQSTGINEGTFIRGETSAINGLNKGRAGRDQIGRSRGGGGPRRKEVNWGKSFLQGRTVKKVRLERRGKGKLGPVCKGGRNGFDRE